MPSAQSKGMAVEVTEELKLDQCDTVEEVAAYWCQETEKARAATATAQAEVEALRAVIEVADEALADALDDMRGEGKCVCGAVKKEMQAAYSATRAALTATEQETGDA